MASKSLVPKGKKSRDKQLTPQKDYLAHMNDLYLVPLRSPHEPFKSPLVYIADALRARGFTGPNLRAALLTMVILNSARLNRRMAEFLVCKDLSIPRTTVSQCLEMIPVEFYRESGIHDHKFLFSYSNKMNGQVLVSTNPEGFKKVISDVINIIDRGYATLQAEAKSTYGDDLREHKINPMISLLGVATGHTDNLPDYPGALYVSMTEHMDKNFIQIVNEQDHRNDKLLKVRIQNNLLRLRPATVTIPFLKKLADHIEKQSPANADKKINIIIDIISLCTIINNPPPFTEFEMTAKFLNMTPEEFSSLTPAAKNDDPKDRSIITSKVDYFMAWVLLKELIPIGSGFLTERQIRVFEALKKHCLDIVHSTFAKKNDPVDQFSTLMNNEDSWPGRDKLYELVNQPGAGGITESTLNSELDVLLKARLIVRVKVGKNKYLYRVNTFDSLKYIDLPHPREIKDPIYNGKKATLVDPLTNIVEEI